MVGMLNGVSTLSPGRRLAFVCAALMLVVAFLTFVGWTTGLPLLASIRAKYIPMAPSTALCFSLTGIGLMAIMLCPRLRWIPRIAAGVVLAVASAKFVEIGGGFRFGIDAWFVRDPALFGSVLTGRMAPLTAMIFVLVAACLLGLASRRDVKWISAVATIVTVVSMVILVGYLYGSPLLYGGAIIPVALLTACGFLLSGIAITVMAGPHAWPARLFTGASTRALLLRCFVPVIIGAALANGWVNAVLMDRMRTNPAVTTAVCSILFAAFGTWIIVQVARKVGGHIDRAEHQMRLAQDELMALNAALETRVDERTRELRTKNEQMQKDLQMARELQTALLPRNFPTIPPDVPDQESALRFLSLYFPTGDVSGDFFSIFPIGENAAGVLICDVMGHGVRSALITSMIRGLVDEHAAVTADPGELLGKINQALTLILKQADITMFATCFYVVADIANERLSFANAGHPCALHVRRGETASAEKLEGTSRRGPAMGIFPDASYTTYVKPMREGDMIMLFTDGLFEVEDSDGTLFSEEQLQETARRHAALAPEEFFGRVLHDVRKFARSESFDDDVCVVGIKVQHMNGASRKPHPKLVAVEH